MKYKSYKDMPVWQESHKLALLVYKVTQRFPRQEHFVLVPQLRRAAVSVPSNIVEGVNRKGTKELIQFLYHSRASLAETEYQLLLAKDLGYIDTNEFSGLSKQIESISKQLHSWLKSVR